jgi:hypothetical protein
MAIPNELRSEAAVIRNLQEWRSSILTQQLNE